jgi:cytochrome c peroxidase
MSGQYYKSILLSIFLILGINFAYYSMSRPEIKKVASRITFETTQVKVEGPLQPLPTIVSIDQNWRALGKALFHSPLLSQDNSISCASCHDIKQGGDDNFPVSIGINSQIGTRNSPTVLNAALNFRQFWDGRESSLTEQIHGPIHNPIEMGSNFSDIINKLSSDPTFNSAFLALDANGITEENIIYAIITYQNSLITNNSPIDRFLLGDKNALNEQQLRGLEKFQRFGCVTCHQGRNIGGNIYQKLGRIDLAPKSLLLDKGRFNVTNEPNDLHVYKVPSLRNVALTAPYFHDGSISTLEDAVRIMAQLQLGMEMADEDVNDIVALLNSFTGKLPEQENNQPKTEFSGQGVNQ